MNLQHVIGNKVEGAASERKRNKSGILLYAGSL